MQRTPVLTTEEYIEQAYFFRAMRERIADGQATQEILEHLQNELLSTTRLPMAVQFMLSELRHSGLMSDAFERLPHYFTPFQAFVMKRAEDDTSRFTIQQALLILERLATYYAEGPSPAGLFVYQLEVLARNRLGYTEGLKAAESDEFYSDAWREYLRLVRGQLGIRDVAELIFARSQHYVIVRRHSEPAYEAPFQILFGEKEGKIAAANIGKDPMFLFSTLQRQLGYPVVPKPPKVDVQKNLFESILQRLTTLENKLNLLEGEVTGKMDLSKLYVHKEGEKPEEGRRSGPVT